MRRRRREDEGNEINECTSSRKLYTNSIHRRQRFLQVYIYIYIYYCIAALYSLFGIICVRKCYFGIGDVWARPSGSTLKNPSVPPLLTQACNLQERERENGI